jgi:prepilin-type processing-associated H-X9-DG protein
MEAKFGGREMKKAATLLSKTLEKRGNTMKNRRSAFTLVELLVVVCIVTLSIAVLIPVLAAARSEVSYKAVCAAKESKILRDIAAYANENDGWYPTACETNGVCSEGCPVDGCLWENGYLRSPQVLWCPADQQFGPVEYPGVGTVERNRDTARSYSFNIDLGDWGDFGGPDEWLAGFKSVADVKIPSRTVLISEVHTLLNLRYNPDHDPPISGMEYALYCGPTPPNLKTSYGHMSGYKHWIGYNIWAASNPPGFAHGQGLNFGFADGHVEFVEVDIEGEYPPFWWFDNGLYPYKIWPHYYK